MSTLISQSRLILRFPGPRTFHFVLTLIATLFVHLAIHGEVLIKQSSEWRYFRGTEHPSPTELPWWDPNFDDSDWPSGMAPFRYGDGKDGTHLGEMSKRYSTLYLRRSFSVFDSASFSVLDLAVNYDDGFMIWINGTLIHSVNAPNNPEFSSLATASHESGLFETFELGDISSLLNKDSNIIAIQAFNVDLASSDFLINAELIGIPTDHEAPQLITVSPKPGRVESLETIELVFSESVIGIDQRDLLLNGLAARSVHGQDRNWTFTFPRTGFGKAKLTWIPNPCIQDLARPGNLFDVSTKSGDRYYQVVDETNPEILTITPPPGTTVRKLDSFELFFTEPVNGFDASDIHINGIPASNVVGFANGPWVVAFDKIQDGPAEISWTGNHGIVDTCPTPNPLMPKSWSYGVAPRHDPGNIVINEFLASNQTGLKDEDGITTDWIELQNIGSNAVNLTGWSLTNDQKQPNKWVFPSITLDSGGYLLVFASGKDRRDPLSKLHTNFKLRSNGAFLGLFNAEWPRHEIDSFSPHYPHQHSDIPYGRSSGGKTLYFTNPTPGSENASSGFKTILNKPSFSKSETFFKQPFELKIHKEQSNSVVRYTMDYTEPTKFNGEVYRRPITISKTEVIRAAAFADNALPSAVATRTFVLSESEAILSLPLLSLVTEKKHLWGDSGIMERNPHNTRKRGIDWERPVSVELLIPGKEKSEFQIDAGLRVQGGDYIRHNYRPNTKPPTGKYSFRLYFRGQYGARQLEHPFFPSIPRNQFEHLVLRAGMNDPINPFIVDELIRRLSSDMGQAASQGTIVNLLLNGHYQGYYNPTERIDHHFLQSRHGGGLEWDIMAQRDEIRAGDANEWNRFKGTSESLDLSKPDHYSRISHQLDIDNFIDYIMLNVYVDMDDWPSNNWRAARERVPGAKWRFYVWDGERAFGTEGKRRLGTLSAQRWPQNRTVKSNNLTKGPLAGSSYIARLFRSLLSNTEFRRHFADRVHKHFYNNGALSNAPISHRHSELKEMMKGVLPNLNPYIEDQWIPHRRAIVMEQLASIGIQRSKDAPVFNQHGGEVPVGFLLEIDSPDGTIYYTTDGADPRTQAMGAHANESSHSPIEINQPVTVKARTLLDSQWSAVTEATFTLSGAPFPVVITEVMSIPTGGSEYEFIELLNSSDMEIDLSRHRIKGLKFTFDLAAKIAPNERLVLASNKNPDAFSRRYRNLEVSGWFSGTLDDEGETLTLVDTIGKTLASLDISRTPFGSSILEGHSLERISLHKPAKSPTNWRASAQQGGTPGK